MSDSKHTIDPTIHSQFVVDLNVEADTEEVKTREVSPYDKRDFKLRIGSSRDTRPGN